MKTPSIKKKVTVEIVPDPTPWISDLEGKMINDENWHCYCSMVVEAKPFYRVICNEFECICHYGYRKFVKCVSMGDVLKMLWVDGNRSGSSMPLNSLCQEIKKSRKSKANKIPADLLAPLLKYKILEMKEESIKEQLIQSLKKTQPMDPPKARLETRGNNKSIKMKEKINTKFHKRGEAFKCLLSVKDCPPSGPNLYIFLVQFQDTKLPMELLNFGVPLTAIIQVGHSDTVLKGDSNAYRNKMELQAEKNKKIRGTLAESVLSVETYLERKTLFKDIRYFWFEFVEHLDAQNLNQFKDLAFMKYIPTFHFRPMSVHFLEDLRTDVYNGLTTIMYEIACLNTYYQSRKKLEFYDFSDSNVAKVIDLEYYNYVLDNLPHETLTIGLILDTLVAQVCKKMVDEMIGYKSDDYPFLADWNQIKKEETTEISCIQKLMIKLNLENDFITENEDYQKITSLESIKTSVIPIIREDTVKLNTVYLEKDKMDFIKDRSIHLFKLFWDQKIWETVRRRFSAFSPNLFQSYIDQMANIVDASYGRNVIMTFLTLSEIERAFELPDGCYDPQYILQEGFLDDSFFYIRDLFAKLISHTESRSELVLAQRNVIREMSWDVFLQKIQKEYAESGCFKWKYFPLIGKVICKCFDFSLPRKTLTVVHSLRTFRDFIEAVFYDEMFNLEKIEKAKSFENDEVNFFDQKISHNLEFPLILNGVTLYYMDCIPKKSSEYQLLKNESKESQRSGSSFTQRSSVESRIYRPKHNQKNQYWLDIGSEGNTVFSFSEIELSFNPGLKVSLKFGGEITGLALMTFVAKFRKKHKIIYHASVAPGTHSIWFNCRPSIMIEHFSGMLFSIQKENISTEQKKLSNDSSLKEESSKYKYNTSFSLPSGLHVVLLQREGLGSYVKQKYVFPKSFVRKEISSEEYRCCLPEGVVLKFMDDNSIIILYANGKIIHCLDYDWLEDNKISQSDEVVPLSNNFLSLTKYITRFPDGKIRRCEKGVFFDEIPQIVYDSYDVKLNEYTTECSDDIFVHKKDGTLLIKYSDGTQITSRAIFQQETVNLIDEENTNEMLDSQYDDFVLIDIQSYEMQHPNFITTCHSLGDGELKLELPDNVELSYYNDGNVLLDLKDGVNIFTVEGKIEATETFKSKVRNKISFNLDVKNSKIVCLEVSDDGGNSIVIENNGNVDINRKNDSNKNHEMEERFFAFDANYNGIQFHTLNEMLKMLEPIKKDPRSLIKVYRNNIISEHLVMLPMDVKVPWVGDSGKPKMGTKPSTFGPSWPHPFMEDNLVKKNRDISCMILQTFKKIIHGQFPIQECLNIIKGFNFEEAEKCGSEEGPESITRDQYFVENSNEMVQFYKKYFGNILDECKKKERSEWVQRDLVDPSVLAVIYKKRLKKVADKYFNLKEKILNKEVPPYFESVDGTTFLTTTELIDKVKETGCNRLRTKKLDRLLSENLNNITSNDLVDIQDLLQNDNRGLWKEFGSKYTLHEVLEAGSTLYPYFKNMEAVLSFHQNMSKEIDF